MKILSDLIWRDKKRKKKRKKKTNWRKQAYISYHDWLRNINFMITCLPSRLILNAWKCKHKLGLDVWIYLDICQHGVPISGPIYFWKMIWTVDAVIYFLARHIRTTSPASQHDSHQRTAIHHYLNIRADLSVSANLQAAPADVYQYNNSCDPEKVQA